MNSINPFLYLLERADFTGVERWCLRSLFSIKDYQNRLFLPDEILFLIVDEISKDKPPFTKHDLIFLQANLNEDKNFEDLLLTTEDPIKRREIIQQWKVIENRLEQIWKKLIKWERRWRRNLLIHPSSEKKYREWNSPIVRVELQRNERELLRLLQRQQRWKWWNDRIRIFLFTAQIWFPLVILTIEYLIKKYKNKVAENNRDKEQKDNYWELN